MSTTSGDPRNLNEFLEGSGPLRGGLTESARAAVAAAQAFAASGSVAGGSLGGLQAMIQLLSDMGANEAFVHSITEALAAADRGGMGPVTVSDATLAARLRADGVGAAPSYLVVSPSSLLGFPPTSGFVDDPVCALTGNFFHAEADLTFPGRAALLDLSRHYNSLGSARVGAFGPGWSSVLDMGLVAGVGEGIVVSLADGAQVGFSAGDDGVLRPETRPGLSLSHLDDGTWVLAGGPSPGATRWRFGAAGTLTAISRGAAWVTLDREGSEVVRLVEASSGRWVALSREGGRISSAASSDGRQVAYDYDENGHLVGVARPSGAVAYRIESGLVAAVVDADGVSSVSNVYDGAGRVTRQRSAFGRVSVYAYSDHGLTVVAGEEGSARNAFVHDRRGNLTTMVDAYGRPQRLRYDDAGRLVGLTERRGGTWETTWDASGSRPLRREGPEGFCESFEWDGSGRIVAHHLGPPGSAATTRWSYASPEHTTPSLIVEPGGARTVIEVSADDLATSITDADGVRAEMAYDADGQMTSLSDALGNVTRLAYDPRGNLAAWRFPSSITLSYDSDEAGKVLRATTPKASWSYEWSAAGRALAGVDPAEGPWRARHGPHGALSSITDPAGGQTSFSYDACGNVVEIAGADGRIYRQGFDGLSQLSSATDPGGATWTYDHDPEGTLVGIVEPTGAATRRVVDLLGRTTSESDAAGRTWHRSYGPDGRLARVVDPAGRAISYRYDEAGRLVEVTDDEGVLGSLSWSPAGRLLSRRGSSGSETRYRYDPAGRLVGVDDGEGSVGFVLDVDGRVLRATDERGRVLVVERDEAGRPTRVTDRRRRVHHVDLDPGGRPTRAGTGPAAASFSHDERGLLARAADPLGATSRFSYDTVGRLASVTDPLGATTRYGYDPAGRLASVTDALGEVSQLLRDPTGAVVGLAWPGGGGRRRWADPAGATTGFSGLDDPGPSVRIELDDAGRPVGLPGRPGTPRSPRRADSPELPLDEVGRVSASPAGDLYRHDAGGQLIEWVPPGRRAVTWRYDPGGRLVSEAAGSSEVTYEHDPLGRLRRRRDADGRVTTYAYNAAGERVSEESPSGAVAYTWDAAGRLTGIARDSEQTGIAFDNLGLPASVGGVGVAWDLSGPWPVVSRIGEVSYEREGDALHAVSPDGSRQAVPLDWAGNAGEILDPWGTSAGTGVRLGYRGELCIGHLVWLGARPYDPATRSFLAPDPLPNPPGAPCAANPYHYAWNDPVSLVDPSGLRPLTQDEFNQRKHAEELGHLGAAWEAIRKDPWGSVALGLTVAAGVGLLFVPGGQAIGAGILIGVALSGGVGIATGTFNPRMVAFNGVIGGITGGVGSAFSGAGIATQVAVGAGIGAGGSVAQQEAFTGHVDWGQVALSAGVGGVAGGGGALLGKLAAARSVNAGGSDLATVAKSGPPPESFYRGMSNVELEGLRQTGALSVRGESFVTQNISYVQQLAARHPDLYESIVHFQMAPGTREALIEAGARSSGRLLEQQGLGSLPMIAKGMGDAVHIKAELGSVTYGLRPGSVHIFNSRIQTFGVVP